MTLCSRIFGWGLCRLFLFGRCRYYQTIESCTECGLTGETDDTLDKTLRPYLVSWQNTETCASIPLKFCSAMPYLSFGSMFFATTQCTLLTSASAYKPPRNFLSCFANSETVQVKSSDGSTIISRPISFLQIGDQVYAANSTGHSQLASVIAVPHSGSGGLKEKSDFVHIVTEELQSLTVTPDHLLVGCDCSACAGLLSSLPLPLVKAGDALAGVTCLMMEGGLVQKVASVTGVRRDSFYTLVTMEEYVVVNGFVASPFAWNHAVGHSFYTIHRSLFRYFPEIMTTTWLSESINYLPDIVSKMTSHVLLSN
jgi:hypothetical protein